MCVFKVFPAVHLLSARLAGLRFLERVRLATKPFFEEFPRDVKLDISRLGNASRLGI